MTGNGLIIRSGIRNSVGWDSPLSYARGGRQGDGNGQRWLASQCGSSRCGAFRRSGITRGHLPGYEAATARLPRLSGLDELGCGRDHVRCEFGARCQHRGPTEGEGLRGLVLGDCPQSAEHLAPPATQDSSHDRANVSASDPTGRDCGCSSRTRTHQGCTCPAVPDRSNASLVARGRRPRVFRNRGASRHFRIDGSRALLQSTQAIGGRI